MIVHLDASTRTVRSGHIIDAVQPRNGATIHTGIVIAKIVRTAIHDDDTESPATGLKKEKIGYHQSR